MYDWEWLEELRKRAAAIAEPIWETLLRDIVRRVRDAGAITSTAEYEIYRAEQLGLAEQVIKDTIAEQLQISNAAIDQLFEDLADETVLFEQNAELRQLVEAYSTVAKKAAAADFENLWAPGPDGKLYTVKEAYAKVMDFAFMQTATGTYDYQRAIREATKELLRRGLRTISGKDNRSYRIEYAVRQYVQNRMGELFNEISARNYDAIGADGWEISAHSAPAPDHAPYQGRQYSEEEYERINASLDRKFGWWNCAHLIYPIKLGVSPPSYTEEERQRYLDENEAGVEYDGLHYTLYEAKQRKRQLESMISQQKYEILAAEGDPKLLREQQIRLQNMRREYQRFCKETNQTPENWRTMVEGFGRSEASKAAWAERKLGLKGTARDITDNRVLQTLNFGKNVTDTDRKEIQHEVAIVPEPLRNLAESRITAIHMIDSPEMGGGFNPITGVMYISHARDPGSVLHEYGHALETALDLYNDPQFLEMRNKGLENITLSDILEDNTSYSKDVYFLNAGKLVSQYQGRLYERYGIYDGKNISLDGMLEYFSEGFRAFFMEPERLRQCDPDLYQYIEEMTKWT